MVEITRESYLGVGSKLCYPYSDITSYLNDKPLKIISASGSKIRTESGKELLDGISSWWSMCHGYSHPEIINAICKQTQILSHIMFCSMTHEPAIELSELLCDFLDNDFQKVFFSDSGSVAVEVAMKMAVQYWNNVGFNKKVFLSFKNGYHGDTAGAMSISDTMSNNYLENNNIITKIPENDNDLKEFEQIIEQGSETLAAVFIEPLLQGAGDIRIHSAEILEKIYKITKKYNILFIVDECATGFYRTGTKFAYMKAKTQPDIIILGKALTGGHIGLAATCITDKVFQNVYKTKFMHGPTFMANPIACSAAIASIKIFMKYDYKSMVENIYNKFCNIGYGRSIGAVFAMEVDKNNMQSIKQSAYDTGIWIRPIGNVLYLMPPLNISNIDLDYIIQWLASIQT